jgi:hypothetical protein
MALEEIPIRGVLLIDRDRKQVFLELGGGINRLVKAVDELGHLAITDPGQGGLEVLAATTNIDRHDGGYMFAQQRPLDLRRDPYGHGEADLDDEM